ncbi:hypothetical protein FFWV33_04715 [Flavobacterium faecale]|uniref:Uncharacterized protein n=1 Tax=Flavobacterium faecale TaxID=1355330 RepID=A0A2S1LAX9_9FLAO|nr:hypothetical protein [Flavobacterium faecale]AWG20892.1 hypothetical protein FFWV33_04715 [Flavobacterium faecale]
MIYVSKINDVKNADIVQYEDMANKYVNAIASALEEFQPGIPLAASRSRQQTYNDLACIGLSGIPIFKTTFPIGNPNRERILNRTACEQNKTVIGAGTPNEQSPVGNPCN